jgi:hypothetical protein
MYFLFLIYLLSMIFILFVFWQGWRYFQYKRLWKKVSTLPFPDAYREILEHIAHYRVLPERLKRKIERSILFFIETKEFRGVGIEVPLCYLLTSVAIILLGPGKYSADYYIYHRET